MPTHSSAHSGNGLGGNGLDGDAAAVAVQSPQSEAAERATSSVLALDGWGRLEPEPEPYVNGAALEAVVEPEPAAEVEPEQVVEPEAEVEPLPEIEWDLEPPAGRRLPWVEEHAPGLRVFGSALVFGLAVGALVGAAWRWLEVRSEPAPPPPDDLGSRLRRAWAAFSEGEVSVEGVRASLLAALGAAGLPGAPRQAEPPLGRWERALRDVRAWRGRFL